MDRRIFLAASAASMAAGKRVRAAVLGTGHSHTYGKYKAMLDNPDFDVAGIAEPDAALLAAAKQDARYANAKWMTEEQLLKDPAIELVVVQCAAWEAIPQGRKVIAAGKHLHLEKPPGNDYKAFKALIDDARKKNLKVQTGYLWRFHQGVSDALAAAKNGWLGEVFMVRATMNSDRDQKQRDVEAKFKGGGLFELSGHTIDRVVELLGRPKAVRSWLRHDTSVNDKLADNNLAVLEYDKALALIMQSAKMSGSGDHRSLELIGTDGTIMVYAEANPPTMRVHMRKAQGPYKAGWQDIKLPPQPRFVEDFKELARAILDNRPLKHSYGHELLLQETLLRASGEMP
ncbi:MAG: Gfo/Idh/MocA family oxidoreductase [Acidobacteria bacterium]|nr:Gfo/Idh/MocA family oxidoreductase [Acidobacteriota bacterium]